MTFGRLTVFDTYKRNGRTICRCRCACGNKKDVDYGNLTSGRQKSCGCLQDENRRRRESLNDLTGKTFGDMYVLRRTENEVDEKGKTHVRYECLCKCGNVKSIRKRNLLSGNSTTCGCGCHGNNLIDLSGRKFEFCEVIERAENHNSQNGTRTMWKCRCCCGKEYEDWSFTILHGRSNCGCQKIRSKSELQISDYLDSCGINYIQQYWFDDLRGEKKKPLYFDFAIVNGDGELQYLIEYQGAQHYMECNHSIRDFGKQQREITDPMKKEYCRKNNIPLYEIRYDQDTITELKNITAFCHDDTVLSA